MNGRHLALIAALLTACGAAPQPEADASADAAADASVVDATNDAVAMPCDNPGETRIVSCARCGMEGQTCGADHHWTPGDCLAQGDCDPGTTEHDHARCGDRARLCGMSCAWLAWEDIVPPSGECTAGDQQYVADATCGAGLWPQTCDSMCHWGATSCTDPCGDARRASPADSEEVCVSGGRFVRGGDTTAMDALPQAEVDVSSFYVDRYVVTNRRYAACVTAGSCDLPGSPQAGADVGDASRADYPVYGITWEQADAFCRWDGRRLLTEAEYEKAMRGPAPRQPAYPWGDMLCGWTSSAACSPGAVIDGSRPPDFFDSSFVSGSASYYGIVGLVGFGSTWVSDFYRDDYYADTASRSNPTGPTLPGPSGEHASRGTARADFEPDDSLTAHRADGPGAYIQVVRCARTP